ncbi:MAG: hypothetical protein SXA11_16800 [Cyanobacteriota bacterium]|nr:hypothetical protein [Cyanobacteriota bacterium]
MEIMLVFLNYLVLSIEFFLGRWLGLGFFVVRLNLTTFYLPRLQIVNGWVRSNDFSRSWKVRSNDFSRSWKVCSNDFSRSRKVRSNDFSRSWKVRSNDFSRSWKVCSNDFSRY